jgi:hypothetical protein
MRYIKVVSDIVTAFSLPSDGIDVVEVGGGYGGQAKTLSCAVDVKSYTIIDQAEPVALAERYLSNFDLGSRMVYEVADNYSPRKSDLFISNYAISELSFAEQEKYYEAIVANSGLAYITYNAVTGDSDGNFNRFIDMISSDFDIATKGDVDGFGNVILFGVAK